MSMSFPLSSSRLWGRLRPLQATPCRLGFNGSWPPIYQPAGPSEWSSSHLSWRLWGVWLKTPSSSFAHWGRPSPRESAPWTRQLKPRSAPNSSSTELLSPCGGGMPSNGFTASQLSLPQRTAVFNSSLFPLLYFLYYIYNKKEKEKRKKFDGLGLATQTVLYSYLSQASCVIVSGFTAALDLDTYPLRKT